MDAYANFIVKCHQHLGISYLVVRPLPIFGSCFYKIGFYSKYIGYIDKYLIFPVILYFLHVFYQRVLILDHSNAAYASVLPYTKRLMACHDVIAIEVARGLYPGQSAGRLGGLLQRQVLRGLGRAHSIVCVSEHTRCRLESLLEDYCGEMTVIGNPVYQSHPILPECYRRKIIRSLLGERTDRYFLHVGSDAFYKNRLGVLRIFECIVTRMPDAYLVFVGSVQDQVFQQAISQSVYRDRVIVLENLSSEDLAALYQGAEALIFPSLAEGFGWPIIEAQANNCVVATSHWDPMRTLAGKAGIIMDPGDPQRCSEKILDGISTKKQRIEYGREQVKAFHPDCIQALYCKWLLSISDK